MAKKKRKHRQPIAPPIHSAPGTANAPRAPQSPLPPSAPGGVANPPAVEAVRPAAGKPRRQTPGSRAAAKRKRSRQRNYLIGGLVLLAIVGAFVAQRIVSNRAINELNSLGEAAGCGEVDDTGATGSGEHLDEGETTNYDESPPTSGPHATATLPAGIYDQPLSDVPGEDATIYRAVHSLEHGAVIVWYDGLKDDDLDELDDSYGNEDKVIVVPYPDLKGDDNVVLTAWGRSMKCEEVSTKVIDKFIDIYREARTAPEANVRI